MAGDQFFNEMVDFIPALSRLHRRFCQCGEMEHALPPAQLMSLLALKKFGVLNMTQLAEYMMVPRQQLTKIIDALEARALVRRDTDPNNRRVVLASITESGAQFLRAFMFGEGGAIGRLSMAMNGEQKKKMLNAMRLFREVLSSLEL